MFKIRWGSILYTLQLSILFDIVFATSDAILSLYFTFPHCFSLSLLDTILPLPIYQKRSFFSFQSHLFENCTTKLVQWSKSKNGGNVIYSTFSGIVFKICLDYKPLLVSVHWDNALFLRRFCSSFLSMVTSIST